VDCAPAGRRAQRGRSEARRSALPPGCWESHQHSGPCRGAPHMGDVCPPYEGAHTWSARVANGARARRMTSCDTRGAQCVRGTSHMRAWRSHTRHNACWVRASYDTSHGSASSGQHSGSKGGFWRKAWHCGGAKGCNAGECAGSAPSWGHRRTSFVGGVESASQVGVRRGP